MLCIAEQFPADPTQGSVLSDLYQWTSVVKGSASLLLSRNLFELICKYGS